MRLKEKWILFGCILIIVIILTDYFSYPDTSDLKQLKGEVNLCLHIGDYNKNTLSYLKDLTVKWVRTDWVNTSYNLMADYAKTLQENSINLLAIIDINTFSQNNFTLQEWNSTVTQIVSSKDFSSVDAVEIWNEPNAGAYINPLTYYEMLKSAYAIIKNYTTDKVVFAGISPNIAGWKTYLCNVFANEDVESYFDYMGIHLYDDTATNFSTLNFIKELTSKPIWVTETGKPSINSETEQAEYLKTIYKTIPSEVSKIFIYELNDGSKTEPPQENYFGLLTVNGSKKEAYDVIKNISQ